MRSISIRYDDGRIFESELAAEIRIIREDMSFEHISDSHLRFISEIKEVVAITTDGKVHKLKPTRIEAKTKVPDQPWMVTIEGPGQVWETFWASVTRMPMPSTHAQRS